MMTFLGYVFLFALLWLMYVSRKYENVNKLYFIAGKKGGLGSGTLRMTEYPVQPLKDRLLRK